MVWLHAALAAMAVSAGSPSQTVLLDFYADWCGPCRNMDPVVKQLAAQGFPIRQVNVDHDRALAAKYRVTGIPCFVMLVDGREVDREVGATSQRRLVQMLQNSRSAPPMMIAATPPAAQQQQGIPVPAAQCALPPPINLTSDAPAADNRTPIVPASMRGARAKTDAELISASVRLRVNEAEGRSLGSGTIIDSRQGEALVLTCGHLFRDSQGKGRIEVDLFGAGAAQSVPGQLISYDLQRDVALVAIRVPGTVAVAPVAPAGFALRVGDALSTVGCDNGDAPTVHHTRVTALGKYLGPPNVQVADVPVLGRSGGGLFTAEGYVVGVCNAADPTDHEGLYAALESVQTQLDQAGLSSLYRDAAAPATPAVETTLVSNETPSLPRQMPKPAEMQPTAKGPVVPTSGVEMPRGSSEEQALFEELHRRLDEGSEVICIIRRRGEPESKSEVLMLDRSKTLRR